MDYLDYLGDDLDYIDDDFELLDFVEGGMPRKVYNRSNYFEEMDPIGFFRRFRLYKETVLEILRLIENQLEYPHDRCVSNAPKDCTLLDLLYIF